MHKNVVKINDFVTQSVTHKPIRHKRKNEIKFTEKIIEGLKPRSKRTIYWCQGQDSFGIRVSPQGTKSWIFIYRIEGEKNPIKQTLGRFPRVSLKEAQRRYLEAKDKVLHGIHVAKEEALFKKAEQEAMTIEQLVPLYVEYCKARGERRWDEKLRVLNKELIPKIGNQKVKDISFRDIAQIIYEIGIERAKVTQATRFLSHTKGMFKYAKNFHGLVEINPCADLEAPKFKKTVKRALDTREIFLVWNNLDNINMSPMVKLGLKFMLCTMTRGVEVRTAEWSEIDLEGKVWIIPDHKAKNGKRHVVPLNGYAIEILEEIKKWTGGLQYVFGWNKALNGGINREIKENTYLKATAFNHAMRVNFDQIGINRKFTPHDLRRTGATLLTSIGYSREWVSKLLNHTPSGVTATYYDTFDYFEEKRAGIECIQYILNRILSSRSVDSVPSIKTLRSEFMAKGLVFEFLKEEYYQNKATQRSSADLSNVSGHVSYTLSYDLGTL